MDAITDAGRPPQAFGQALESLQRARTRSSLPLAGISVPSRLAPYGIGFAAQLASPEAESRLPDGGPLAAGRFMLLHDPDSPEPWGGPWRIVCYVRAGIEADLGEDGLLPGVVLDWIREALDEHDAAFSHLGGTTTRLYSQGFGDLADRPDSTEIELRASWSPDPADPRGAQALPDVGRHLLAWADVLRTYAGMPPLPENVSRFPGPRR